MSAVVSVILPVLSGAPFLGEAIASIQAQSMADLELIVVDDGSDDGSQAIAEGYAALDPRLRCLALPRDPATASGARASNAGLAVATGAYIARMDADDIAPPDRLAIQLQAMADRGLDVVGGQVQAFGDRNDVRWYPESHDGIASELLFRSGLTNPSMLARAEVLRAAGFSEIEAYEEYELQTRLIGAHRFGNCPEIVLRQRAHPRQTTRVLSQRKWESRQRLLFGYFFRRFPQASLADFRCVFALGLGTPFEERDELALAGDWLVRLSRLPEARLRQRMARRWADACDVYAGPAADVAALHDYYEGRIVAAP